MNITASDHLHTQDGEHIAIGEFHEIADHRGVLQVEGEYPDLGANTLYQLKRADGSRVDLLDVSKDPDSRLARYHLQWS